MQQPGDKTLWEDIMDKTLWTQERHYGSKKFTHAERKYWTIEKECLAVVWMVTKFCLFLAGKPFIL